MQLLENNYLWDGHSNFTSSYYPVMFYSSLGMPTFSYMISYDLKDSPFVVCSLQTHFVALHSICGSHNILIYNYKNELRYLPNLR